MDSEALKELFYSQVAEDRPNEWDVDEQLAEYHDCEEPICREIFARIPAIWPVSHSLCYNYLAQARKALTCLDISQLDDWVRGTLKHYETGGLRAAQAYMGAVESTFLCTLRGEDGVTLTAVAGRLLPYARGLIGAEIDLIPGPAVSTDTTTITLPPLLRLFRTQEDNFLLYKLIISYQWAFMANQTLNTAPKGYQGEELWLLGAVSRAANPDLLTTIYLGLETLRATHFLERELPGLMRRSKDIRLRLSPPLPLPEAIEPITLFFHWLQVLILGAPSAQPGHHSHRSHLDFPDLPGLPDSLPNALSDLLPADIHQGTDSPQESFHLAIRIHDLLVATPTRMPISTASKEFSTQLPIFSGQMDLAAINHARQQKTRQLESRFIDDLASFIINLPPGPLTQSADSNEPLEQDHTEKNTHGPEDCDTAMILEQPPSFSLDDDTQSTLFINLDNEQILLPDALQDQAAALRAHLGHLPDRYLSSAAGRAGSGLGRVPSPENTDIITIQAPLLYDEWDYRRGGFRKNWCALLEKELPSLRSTFVATTRERYRGQIIKLQRQFEMMRTRERFVRRQTDGTDIDLDSLVESLADSRAGVASSDRLFIRLQRNERDIAVLFLVDLSNSTEGWVGKAIKEALVLICEAMEIVGDRYGIYGFSGMRRTRCEIFRVKELSDTFDEKVKGRIGALGPREYTRMGPAIRHMTSLFKGVDAKLRLMITLTDGKPEDYDDYKGEYAIEDTRHALIEAKSADIHPFCITIDQQAHEYMEHMYGRGNYIFVDQVAKLPARMTDMYRILTS